MCFYVYLILIMCLILIAALQSQIFVLGQITVQKGKLLASRIYYSNTHSVEDEDLRSTADLLNDVPAAPQKTILSFRVTLAQFKLDLLAYCVVSNKMVDSRLSRT